MGRGMPRVPAFAYDFVQDEGIFLPQQPTLDFVGGGVTATDDPANQRTVVTIPLGGGLNPPANPADNNKVAYGLAGNLSYTSQIRTDGTYFSFAVGVGFGPALSGTLRFGNTQDLRWRNAAGGADVIAFAVNAANEVVIGGTNCAGWRQLIGAVVMQQVDALATDYSSWGVAPAQSGYVRLPNTGMISWRNQAGLGDVGNINVDVANQLQPIASATLNGFESTTDYLNIWGETGVDVAIPIGAGYVDVETSALVFLSVNNNYRYFGAAWAAWEVVASKAVFPDLMQFVVIRYNDATVRITCLTDGSTVTGAVPAVLTGVSVITGLKWRVTIDATYHIVWGIGQDAAIARTGRATLFDFGRTNTAT